MLYRPRSCRIHRQEACHFSCLWGASPCDGIRPRVCMMERLSVTCQTALHVRAMLSIPSSPTWSTPPQMVWSSSRGSPVPWPCHNIWALTEGAPTSNSHCRICILGGADLAMQRGPNFPEKLTTSICLRSPIGFEISWAVSHFCAPASLVDPTHHNPVYTTLAVRPSASRQSERWKASIVASSAVHSMESPERYR